MKIPIRTQNVKVLTNVQTTGKSIIVTHIEFTRELKLPSDYGNTCHFFQSVSLNECPWGDDMFAKGACDLILYHPTVPSKSKLLSLQGMNCIALSCALLLA